MNKSRRMRVSPGYRMRRRAMSSNSNSGVMVDPFVWRR